jgi:hypothetical protein
MFQQEQVEQTIDFFAKLPSDRLIGAMIVSLAAALVTTYIYRWMVRRKQVAATCLLTLVFLANLACMLATVCFVHSTIPTVRMVNPSTGLRRQRIAYMYDHFARPDDFSSRTPSRTNPPANGK